MFHVSWFHKMYNFSIPELNSKVIHSPFRKQLEIVATLVIIQIEVKTFLLELYEGLLVTLCSLGRKKCV